MLAAERYAETVGIQVHQSMDSSCTSTAQGEVQSARAPLRWPYTSRRQQHLADKRAETLEDEDESSGSDVESDDDSSHSSDGREQADSDRDSDGDQSSDDSSAAVLDGHHEPIALERIALRRHDWLRLLRRQRCCEERLGDRADLVER